MASAFDPSGIYEMLQMVNDQFQRNQSLSTTNYAADVRDMIKSVVADYSKITEKELHKIVDILLKADRTKYGSSGDLTQARKEFEEALTKMSKQIQINGDLLANFETSFKSKELTTSRRYEETGVGRHSYNLQGTQYRGSVQAQEETKELSRPLDNATNKILSFFKEKENRDKVNRRHFTEDLIEGLGKSKFFGGAIIDLIRLGTFFIASFLKEKGPLGKALAVALVAAGPIIGAAVVAGLTKVLTTGLTKLGALIFAPIRWLGRSLLTAIGRGITTLAAAIWGSKALSGIRGGLASLGIGARGMGAVSRAGMALAPGMIGFGGAMVGTAEKQLAKNTATSLGATIAKTAGKGFTRSLVGGSVSNPVGIALTLWMVYDIIKAIWDWWKGRENKKEQGGFGSWFKWGSKSSDSPNKVLYDSNKDLGVSTVKGQNSFAGHTVTSQFGMRVHPVTGKYKQHTGVDLAYNYEDVGAFTGGKVVFAGKKGGYGNAVVVRDALGTEHLYGHLNSISKDILGKDIQKGDILGVSGMTGTATGPHLHYETKKDGKYINPIDYLNALESPVSEKTKDDRKRDKFAQNVIDYWTSHGEDKGGIRLTATGIRHSKADDYNKLAEKYKKEYALSVMGSDISGGNSLKYSEGWALAVTSQEAKDYANRKIAEYVASKSAEAQAVSYARSLRLQNGEMEKPEEVSGSSEAFQQWGIIKKRAEEDRKEKEQKVSLNADKDQIKIDITGTELCSNVLRNTLNAQQQAFRQV